MGITNICYDSRTRYYTVTEVNIATSYYSICLSLNVDLMLMIVMQLVMHIRNIRKATGASNGSSGLHTAAATVVMMLIASTNVAAVRATLPLMLLVS